MPSNNYFSRIGTAIQRSIVGKEESAVIGQRKLWFWNSKFYHSVNYSSCSDLSCGRRMFVRPASIALASRSESVGKSRKLSVVDALSRTFSIPSVSGPSFQVCGYHIDRAISGPGQFSAGSKFQSKTMAAQLSRVVVGECCLDNLALKPSHRSLSTMNSSNIGLSTSLGNGRKVSMSLKSHQQPDHRSIYGFFVYNAAKTWCSSSPYSESGSRDFYSSSSSCFSAGPAHDVPFDTSAREEQLTNSADSSAQYVLSLLYSLL